MDDAAGAAVAAIDRGAPGVYNIVDDEPAPVSAWLPVLAEAVGAKPPRHVPVWIGRLAAGETLDGEGGYTVYGRLMRAEESLRAGALPIGLAHGVALLHPVAARDIIRWADVAIDATHEAVRMRREMERASW